MTAPAPDGITPEHERSRGKPSPLPILFLGAVLAAGLAGLYGGQSDPVREVRADGTTLSIRVPTTLRNGMFFETVVEVSSERPIDDLVIGVSDGLWREMTINTTIPTAQEESYSHGFQRFSFGETAAGDRLRFKIDGQVNPPLFAGTRGEVAAFDGERKLVGLPIHMRVLP